VQKTALPLWPFPLISRLQNLPVHVTAIVLAMVFAPRVLAQEEPAARAVLPPPLSSSRSDTDSQQKPVEISSFARPTIRLDQSRTRAAERKSSASPAADRGAWGAKGRLMSPERRYLAANKALRHQTEKVARLGARRRRGRSAPEPKVGHLSPPSNHSTSQIETAPTTRVEPPQMAIPYYSGPYGYLPAIPYSWLPPAPGYYR
jgi:hypothetical protein